MSPKPPLAALFDQGQTPTICLVLQSITPLGFELSALASALQEYVDKHYQPVWGAGARFVISDSVIPGTWGMIFLDNADVAGALGYHDLTSDGFPLSKIFVKTLQTYGENVATTASHELEFLIDPGIQMSAMNYKKRRWEAYETHDAVQATSFDVQGFPMSNFVYPSWFESFRETAAKFDHMGLCSRPFQIIKGGYMSVMPLASGQWNQVFASVVDEKKFQGEVKNKLHNRAMLRPKETSKFKKSKLKADPLKILAKKFPQEAKALGI